MLAPVKLMHYFSIPSCTVSCINQPLTMADDIYRNVNDYGLPQINSRKGLITELLGSKYSYRKWVKTNQ